MRADEVFNPFPGFRAYDVDEDYLFFGREEATDELLRKLRAHRFVAVVGSSGSGKSSLVRAGLITALHGGFMVGAGGDWRIAVMRPGNDPLGQLAAELQDPEALGSETDEDPRLSVDIAAATLRRSPQGIVHIYREARPPPGTRLLILVDQLEELFRFRKSVEEDHIDAATTFVELLLAATRGTEPIYVILTLRSDFVGDCAQFHGLTEAINRSQYLIPRLLRSQLAEAITGPTRVGGGEISRPLLQRVLNEVGADPDHLPMMQHALMRTFDEWQRRGRFDEPLELDHYQTVGGMTEALSRHADEVIRELPERLVPLVEKVFKCLTEKGEDGRGVRRPTTMAVLCAVTEEPWDDVATVVAGFRGEGRAFLTASTGDQLRPESVIDISHESLMRVGTKLPIWLEEEAEAARFFRFMSEVAARNAEGKAALWRNPELEIAARWRETNRPNAAWAERYGGDFGPAMRFLDDSRQAWHDEEETTAARRQRELDQAQALAAAEHEKAEQQERAARRLRRALAGVVVTMLVALGSALWATHERAVAQREQAAAARAEILALCSSAHAVSQLGKGIEALSTALEAADRLAALDATRGRVPADRHQVVAALTHALYEIHERNRWRAHDAWINSTVWSAAGEGLVSAGYSKTIRVWRPDGTLLRELEADPKAVFALDVSPDGQTLAVGGGGGQIHLWRLADGSRLRAPFEAHGGAVRSLAYSPDGTRLASVGDDGVLRLWTPAGAPAGARAISRQRLAIAAWSRDGSRLATGGVDGSISVLDASMDPVAVLAGHRGGVHGLSFGIESATLVSGGADGAVRLWSPAGDVLWQHDGESAVLTVRFSADGEILASAGSDRRIYLWHLAGGDTQLLDVYRGHNEPITSLSFSPDSSFLVSGSQDMSLKVWQLDNGLQRTLRGHRGTVWSVDFRPQGNLLASGSLDGTVRIWSRGGVLRRILTGHEDLVRDVAFSPDGRWLASASHDATLRLWPFDQEIPRQAQVLGPREAGLNQVAFDADSRRMVTAGLSGQVDIWEVGGDRVGGFVEASGAWGASFAADGILTASPDGIARLRPLGGGAPRRMWPHGLPLLRARFSPDGRRMVTSMPGGGDADLWPTDAERDTPIQHLDHGGEGVNGIAFSADGRLVATAGIDGTVRLWRTEDGRLQRTLRGHDGGVTDVAFSLQEPQLLASSSYDGTIKIWARLDMELEELIARGREWLGAFHHLQQLDE